MTTDSFEYTWANKYYYLFCEILCVPSLNHVIIEMRKKWSLICVSSQSHASMKIAILKKHLFTLCTPSFTCRHHCLCTLWRYIAKKETNKNNRVFFRLQQIHICIWLICLFSFIAKISFETMTSANRHCRTQPKEFVIWKKNAHST